MTTQAYHRCAQCGDQYTYQGSGPGCGRAENDPKWCPICKGIVDRALADVPRLFECRYRPTSEVKGFEALTMEMLKEWETKPDPFHTRLDGTNPPIARRIWPGLYNLETGDSQNIYEVQAWTNAPYPYRSRRFRVSTWRQDPEFAIELAMEYDLREGRFTGRHWPH